MKSKSIKVCKAIHVDITCKENDSADIKCGGPATLGYDFYLSSDKDEKEIKKFLKSCLKKYNRPYINIIFHKEKNFPIKKLWTKKKIEKCIKNHNI